MSCEYVYLIKSGDFWTVGRTKSLDDRVSAYLTHNPIIEKIIAMTCNGNSITVEEHFRKLFSKSKISSRDWYRLSEDEITEFIRYEIQELVLDAPHVSKSRRLSKFIDELHMLSAEETSLARDEILEYLSINKNQSQHKLCLYVSTKTGLPLSSIRNVVILMESDGIITCRPGKQNSYLYSIANKQDS